MQGSTHPTRERPRHITSDLSITTILDTKTIYFKLSAGVVVVADVYPHEVAIRSSTAEYGGQAKKISNRLMEKTAAYMRSTRDRKDRVDS